MQNFIRQGARSAVNSTAWKKTSEWIRGGRRRRRAAGHEISGVPVPAEVVVYFGDTESKAYQLEQWIPVLEKLNETRSVLLVFRKTGALRHFKSRTTLPKIFVRRFDDLATLYYENEYRLGLYVNNGVTNFQSLSFAPMVHVHVNHGESDKVSMVSNQAKAYDKVFIAGQAARERHAKALLDFDDSKLVAVGRPQLDIPRESELPASGHRTVMYAPTWEGENEANNYTSVDTYGVEIVSALLSLPNTRVVYKPHPRVENSKDAAVAEANARILELLEEANTNGGDHLVEMQGDILAMFDDVSLLVTDVSSVGLDFLYLHADKPLVLTDRRDDVASMHEESPISRATPLIDHSTVEALPSILEESLTRDPHVEERKVMRAHYFGEGPVGSSTKAFLDAVDLLITEREEKLLTFVSGATNMEAED